MRHIRRITAKIGAKVKFIKDRQILAILSGNPAGLTVDEIEKYRLEIPRRTLQRRLHQMVESKILAVTGQTRARRYRATSEVLIPASAVSGIEQNDGGSASFVPLNRRFYEIAIPPEKSPEDLDLAAWRIKPSQSWDDVLKNSCSIIIAEAGSGKTTEMRNQARLLRDQGKSAFFGRLELMTTPPLQAAFEIGSGRPFEQWLAGEDRGFFFLDSVDEAVLANQRDFERAIITFVNAVDAQLSRCVIVISSRPGAWRGDIDADMLCRRLGLGRPTAVAGSAGLPNPADGSDVVEDAVAMSDDTTTKSRLVVLQMEALDQARIEAFAHSQAPQHADKFISELLRTDALAFATRPDDLSGLIDIWSKNGAIGTYTDVIDANLRGKLLAPTGSRTSMSVDKIINGAERLAAAVVFTRRSSIRLSETSVTSIQRSNTLSPQQVLKGWAASEIKDLLERPLFDPSQYGCVRFHHRTFVEYLAARWLKRLLGQGAPRRSIEKLLFAHPYSDQVQVMVPSMKPIAAWLAASDQDVIDKIIRLEPRTLIEYGDAAQLDISVRAEVLRKFAAQYQDRRHTPLRASPDDVRRLAAPGIGALLNDLLTANRNHHDVRQLLLRVIREGGTRAEYECCADTVTSFAVDGAMDAYTRSCAIQVCAIVCDDTAMRKLVSTIINGADALNRTVLAAAIEVFFPSVMTTNKLAVVLEKAAEVDEFTSDHLCYQIEQLVDKMSIRHEQLELLTAFEDLLSRAPLVDDNYGRVSAKYSWLLQPAFILAASVFEESQAPFAPTLLSIMSKALQANHLHRYTGDVHKEASELVLTHTDLKHALFWFEIEQKRAVSTEPVRDSWFATSHELQMVNDEDFALLIASLSERPLLDDRVIALKALVRLYIQSKRPRAKLQEIKGAISSCEVLTAALEGELKRGKLSPEVRASMSRLRAAESRNDAKRKANEASRRSWIETLKADPSRVGDASLAAAGGVWNNTIWLHDEIRRRKDSSTWTVTGWQALADDFGPVVAQNFRDLCQAYWRAYKAELRSEMGGEKNSTPWSVIIGLSGLAMEAQANANWAARIDKQEAENATRLALLELNSFPDWIWSLYRQHPDVVSGILIHEAKWEFSLEDGKDTGYVLARLRWTAKELAAVLRPEIATLLKGADAPRNSRVLFDALTVILRDPAPLPSGFLNLVADRADEANEDEVTGALWISAQICIDAANGTKNLSRWLDATDARSSERRMSLVLENIWSDRYAGLQSQHRNYMAPAHLVALIRLAHSHVRHVDDIAHSGTYSPGLRDHAQSARSQLLKLLCELPGRKTYEGLSALANDFKGDFFGDRLLELADERAEADAEPVLPWTADDVATFNDEAERIPSSEVELYNIARARLDDLKLELEDGDESEASLLRKVSDELELRRVIARRLRQIARDRYTTASEEELADESRTDIRLHNPRVPRRVPIELKIADKWSAVALRERLENQLVKQYLLESRLGIFLLVRRGASSDRTTWSLPHHPKAHFDELVDWLNTEAALLLKQHRELLGLSVIGIDLTKRETKRSAKVVSTRPNLQPAAMSAKRAK